MRESKLPYRCGERGLRRIAVVSDYLQQLAGGNFHQSCALVEGTRAGKCERRILFSAIRHSFFSSS